MNPDSVDAINLIGVSLTIDQARMKDINRPTVPQIKLICKIGDARPTPPKFGLHKL